MSANPFKLRDEVKEDYEVERITTKINYKTPTLNKDLKLDIKWRIEDEYMEVLTLGEILEQIKEIENNNRTPYLTVEYESGLWGVIFEVGNYKEKGETWIVHGVTKGYA